MKFLQGSLFLLLLQNVSAFTPTSNKSPFIQSGTQQSLKQNPRLETTQLFDLNKLEQYTPDDEETKNLLDEYGEKSRKYRRNVYGASDWVYSRRPDRIISNLSTTFDSGLVRQLGFELTFLFFSSSFIVGWNDLFVKGWQDFGGVPHEPITDIIPGLILPLAPFSLSVSTLALLLTFRTNTSYARWNEARTAWGKIINDSRSIARMGCTWGKSYKNITTEMVQRLGEAILSFSRSVMNRTLPPQEDEKNFQEYTLTRLTDADYGERLRNAKHRPTTALAEITNCLVDMELNPVHQVEVEKTVTGLCDALGACERIFTSPVPTFYPRHTARFLALWLLALPTGLYEAFGSSWNHIGVVPVTLFVSGFLLGIEELSTQMEEPFSILPMEKMCEGSIRTSVMEQVERSREGIQAEFKGYDTMAFTAAAGGFGYQQPESFDELPVLPTEVTDMSEASFIPEPEAPAAHSPTQDELNAAWARNAMGKP